MKTKLIGLFTLLLLSAQMKASTLSSPPLTVNEKVMKAFHDAFPHASTIDWKESENSYFVHFKENQAVSEIEYDHEGNFIESQRYYTDIDLLPLHLASDLNKKFKGKTVFGITEINNESEITYYIKMQDDKEWITVKGTASGIDRVVERFTKQN
jgi:hypothetical protein